MMGWTYGHLSTRNRFPDIRMSEVVKLADVLGAPRGEFITMFAEYLCGPQPVYPNKLALDSPIEEWEIPQRVAGRPKFDRKLVNARKKREAAISRANRLKVAANKRHAAATKKGAR